MMHWEENVRLALRALIVDKVKAFLTMLGVMIGSASIVLVVTIASSGKLYVVSQIEGIGANLAYATLDRSEATTVPADELSTDDLNRIRLSLPMVAAAAGTYDVPITFSLHGRLIHARLVGVTEEFQKIRNLVVLSGRYFDAEDYSSRSRVCLITERVAEEAFPFEPATGRTLEIQQFQCTIIGVFKEGVPTFGMSEIQQETVLVPFPLVKTITGDDFFQVIYAQAKSSAEVPAMTSGIESALRTHHREVARYQVQNLVSVLHTVGSVSVALSLVLMAVALLTLITAGTGIMNIMFVNIAQRTREIGLRKAIGARPAEIRMQFLLEAAFISFAGAAIGVVIAMGLVWLVTGWVTADVPISISWSGVSIALLLSTAIGTSFGYQPASRAASLNPVEALRAE
jgi:putative ABC transport system permease protein